MHISNGTVNRDLSILAHLLPCADIISGIALRCISCLPDFASIRKSVEAEVNFIGNIASPEMTHAVTERILRTVKAASKEIP